MLVLCAVMLAITVKQERMLREQVHAKATALFDMIVLTRRWNAEHGGVLVEKTPGVESNPYLKDPDIQGQGGKSYTRKNPALMTRELSEYALEENGFRFHITSRQPKNPANAPAPWERRALHALAQGKPEWVEIVTEGDERQYRLMKPLFVEQACLSCHGESGYALGDLRGGISISLPFSHATHLLQQNYLVMAILSTALLVVFMLVLYGFIWRLLSRLSRQKSELETLNVTRDRFLGMAAHDLRGPLTVVTGMAHLLEEDVPNEPQAHFIQSIIASSDRMLGMVDNLLDTSKICTWQLDLHPEETDLTSLLKSAAEFNSPHGEAKGISLVCDFGVALGTAKIDPERIRQVIDNLLTNAFKYSETGSTVTLALQR